MRSIIVSVVLCMVLVACKKMETLSYPPLSDYYPLQVGKTFTYRLDSTIRLPFGVGLTVKYYLAKDSVESQFNDAQGRPSFRIYRYVTDTLKSQPWTYKVTNIVTFDHNNQWIEYVENNLRYILLRQPLSEGFNWNGNSYIDTRSANSTVRYLEGWDYTYQDMHLPFTVRKGTFDSTITVLQADEMFPPGPFDPSAPITQKNYSKEVYAKGVGLIYKEFLHWEWQSGHYMDDAYGVKLNLVDYK